jgi:hypothetical protein
VLVAGFLGRAVRSAQLLSGTGAPRTLAIGPGRTVLAVLDARAAGRRLRLRVGDAAGHTATRDILTSSSGGTCLQPLARTARVADPDGGPPWVAGIGRVGPPGRRQGCRFVGRLVDGRVAFLTDDDNRVFYGTGWSTGTATGTRISRAINLQVASPGSMPFGGPPASTPALPAQVVRRTLPGRTVITGVVAPGVTSVTLRTPRDIRTLRPTRDRLVLAVFDGTFYGGEIVATSRFRDGRTVVDRRALRPSR